MSEDNKLAATQTFEQRLGDQRDRLVSTGNTQLDYILGGGLSPNSFILVEGDPGAGKTTLALEFARQGILDEQSVLYIALTEAEEELTSVADSHEIDLSGIHLVDLSPGSGALTGEDATMYHPSDVELGELTQSIIDAFEKYDPRRVIIDSLSELRHLAQNDLRYRRQLIALKSFFRSQRCTVLVIDDRQESVDLQLQGIARGTIELQRTTPSYGRIRRRLQVSKMRGQRVRSGYHDFTIEKGGLAIYPRLIAAEHEGTIDHGPVSSGLQALDDLLGGGFQRGTSTLVIGAAGTGKSSLAAQYAHAARQSLGDGGSNASAADTFLTRQHRITWSDAMDSAYPFVRIETMATCDYAKSIRPSCRLASSHGISGEALKMKASSFSLLIA